MNVTVRALRPDAEDEIALVAARMRSTLIEVLGEPRGTALYTMDWLRERARFHLDPSRCRGQIFLAEVAGRGDGPSVVGHTIVRVDRDDDGSPIGLFSTTFVVPEARRLGIAESLVRRGEAWMSAEGMTVAVTDTSATNTKLIRLFEKHGYAIALREGEMVRLEKRL